MKPQNAAALVAAGCCPSWSIHSSALGWLGKGRGRDTAAGPIDRTGAEAPSSEPPVRDLMSADPWCAVLHQVPGAVALDGEDCHGGRGRQPGRMRPGTRVATAVQVLDRLHGIVRAIADRPDPSGSTSTRPTCAASSCPFRDGTWPSDSRSRRSVSTERVLRRSRGKPWRSSVSCRRAWLRDEVVRRHSLDPKLLLTPDALGLG